MSGSTRLVIVVTSGGLIGDAVVRHFTNLGAEVAVVTAATADRDVSERSSLTDRNWLDSWEDEQARESLQRLAPGHNTVDTLITVCESREDDVEVAECSLVQFGHTVDLVLRAPFLAMRHVFPLMRDARSGSIVNIVSVAGVIGLAGRGAECAATAGLIHLTRAVALAGKPYGIRANAVSVRGDDTNGRDDSEAASSAACVAEFLASDGATLITGSVVLADGGFVAGMNMPFAPPVTS